MTGMTRRQLALTLAAAPLTLAVGGCATGGGYSLTEAIRRLLTLSSQRAFAVLLQPGGYYDSQVARLALPPRYASATGLVGQILNSGPVRDRLSRTLNGIAERGAERAAPVITNAISTLTVADALSVVRGGERAATDLLSGQIGSGVIEAMFPAVGDALRLAGDNTLSRLLRSVTGYDVAALARDVTDSAARGLWNGIAAEEAAIRANPQATNDPLLTAVFTLAR